MATSTSVEGESVAHLVQQDAVDGQARAYAARRSRRRQEPSPMRVSAVAYQHLGDEGLALEAAYQMILCIRQLLDDDDFTRIRAFAAAAYHPDHTPDDDHPVWTQLHWSQSAREHLGPVPHHEGLRTAHAMMHCINGMLAPDEIVRVLDFLDAAYSRPEAQNNTSS